MDESTIDYIARAFDVPVDLLTLTRKHDLPPRWDGLPVTWRDWEKQIPMFICPPPKIPAHCKRCGSVEAPTTNRGRVEPDGDEVTVLAGTTLYAFRCPDCGLDTVWDISTDQWWTLDHTDYGDEGSTEPATRREEPAAPSPKAPRASGRAAFAAARAELQAKKNQETLL